MNTVIGDFHTLVTTTIKNEEFNLALSSGSLLKRTRTRPTHQLKAQQSKR